MDVQHHLHPFTDTKILKENGSRIITKAEGVYLWDSDGNKIIDGMAGLWCVNIGYGRKELVDVAQEQMNELPYYNNFFQTTHPPAIELSKVLADISPPQFNHVFLQIPDRKPMIQLCAWQGTIGHCKVNLIKRLL